MAASIIGGAFVMYWRIGAMEKRMDANDARWQLAATEAKADRKLMHEKIDADRMALAELTGYLRGRGVINGVGEHNE